MARMTELDKILLQVPKNSDIGVIVTDHNGVSIWANECLQKMSGYDLDFIVSKTPGQVLQGPETDQKDIDFIREGLQSKKPFKCNILNYDKSGQRMWINLHISPIFGDDGEVTHFIGIQNDITSIKEQNEKLENFNYIVSHNLINQVNNVCSLIGLISRNENIKANKSINILDQTSKKLLDTVSSLKELLKVQNSPALPNLKEVNIRSFLDQILLSMYSQIKDAQLTIVNNIDESLTITTNCAYLESILANLLSNGIKYRDLSKKNCYINFSSEELADDIIKLLIEDNGIGIDLTIHGDEVFNAFQTFHDNQDAVGMGLYLTKNQVHALGGHIEVDSKPHKGATFSVFLPKFT